MDAIAESDVAMDPSTAGRAVVSAMKGFPVGA